MSQGTERELSLRDYVRVVARRKWFVVLAVVMTVGTALSLSAMQEPVYQAEAQMLVRTRGSDTIFENGNSGAGNEIRAIDTEIEVLQSQVVAERVRDDLALTILPAAADGSTLGATDVVVVRVRSGEPDTARALADAYVRAYIDVKREQAVNSLVSAGSELQKKVTDLRSQIDALDLEAVAAEGGEASDEDSSLASRRRSLVDQQALFKQRLDQIQVDAALTTGGAEVVKRAETPTEPVEPTPVRTAILALFVGLILGLGAAFVIDYFDDSMRSADDIELASGGLPVLAVVPLDPPPDNRPIALSRPSDYAVETYRSLRTALQFVSLESETRVIQVTSPLASEGKTTTAANLAVVFAQAAFRVLLIDADLRKPRLHEVFAVDHRTGLTDALLGEPFQLVVKSVIANLDVMPSGPVPPNPSELLGGKQMKALVNTLTEEYDIVIIDSAPVLPVTDSVALATVVQGVVLVTQAGRTSSRHLTGALSSLRRVQAPLLGVVLNKAGGRRRANRQGYGYGYGHAAYGQGVTGLASTAVPGAVPIKSNGASHMDPSSSSHQAAVETDPATSAN